MFSISKQELQFAHIPPPTQIKTHLYNVLNLSSLQFDPRRRTQSESQESQFENLSKQKHQLVNYYTIISTSFRVQSLWRGAGLRYMHGLKLDKTWTGNCGCLGCSTKWICLKVSQCCVWSLLHVLLANLQRRGRLERHHILNSSSSLSHRLEVDSLSEVSSRTEEKRTRPASPSCPGCARSSQPGCLRRRKTESVRIREDCRRC